MIEHVAVVVPAADEQDRIGRALDALRAAVAHVHRSHPAVRVDLTVVLDGCTDATDRVVAGYPEIRSLPVSARSVGVARDTGSRTALSTLAALDAELDLGSVWTAHTDADSQVPLDWLTTMIRAADQGVDLLLGTVLPSLELAASARHTWLARHCHADGHRHVHGANFGIRGSVLDAVGGWPRLRSGEDVELAARAKAARAVVRSSAAAPVRTSSRTSGRAPGGFAAYLSGLVGGIPA